MSVSKFIDGLYPYPFVIAANGRSGSHFLMDLINSSGVLYPIGEYLPRSVDHPSFSDDHVLSFFEDLFFDLNNRQTLADDDVVWGTKVDMNQLVFLNRFLKLCNVDPSSLKWIWLSRKNKILQALSFFRADYSDVWSLREESSTDDVSLASSDLTDVISIRSVFQRSGIIALLDFFWDVFFHENGIVPYKIFYEDIVLSECLDSVVANIFDFLDVDYSLPFGVSSKHLMIRDIDNDFLYRKILEKTLEEFPFNLNDEMLR